MPTCDVLLLLQRLGSAGGLKEKEEAEFFDGRSTADAAVIGSVTSIQYFRCAFEESHNSYLIRISSLYPLDG